MKCDELFTQWRRWHSIKYRESESIDR